MVQAERAADLMRNELDIAASIQQSLIAKETPTFPYARVSARTSRSAPRSAATSMTSILLTPTTAPTKALSPSSLTSPEKGCPPPSSPPSFRE